MKKQLHILFALLTVFMLSSQAVFAQKNEVPAELINGFKTANASVVAQYFNENVDMVVPQAENLYTKAQAKTILADFFRKNPVKGFLVVHKGTKENAAFLIANHITTNGSFRVSIFTRKTGAQFLVYQLRIEKSE